MKTASLLLALFVALSPVASAAQGDKALMLAVFGTSTEASVAFDELLPAAQKQFPGRMVVIPYTSGVIRKKLNADVADPAKKILSPDEMLEKLKQDGHTDIVVASTLVFAGVEHERLKASVDAFRAANRGLKVFLIPPLLADPANLRPVADTLKKHLLPAGINLVVAHGTRDGHPAEKTYMELADLVAKTHPNARVISIEGVPSKEEGLAWAKSRKEKDVRFVVFMFVAGDHAENDVAGDGEDSLFSLVKKMGKKPSVPWTKTKAGKRIASLGLDPDYRNILLDYLARNIAP